MNSPDRLKSLVLAVLLTVTATDTLRAAPPSASDRRLARAYQFGQSEFFVRVRATVLATLPYDYEGIRHQKFLVELSTGQTLLVAHNIDLAGPVRRLRAGETILIYGEYVWNAEGGLIHRTHDDPDFLHPHGWIRYQGRRYQ